MEENKECYYNSQIVQNLQSIDNTFRSGPYKSDELVSMSKEQKKNE